MCKMMFSHENAGTTPPLRRVHRRALLCVAQTITAWNWLSCCFRYNFTSLLYIYVLPTRATQLTDSVVCNFRSKTIFHLSLHGTRTVRHPYSDLPYFYLPTLATTALFARLRGSLRLPSLELPISSHRSRSQCSSQCSVRLPNDSTHVARVLCSRAEKGVVRLEAFE